MLIERKRWQAVVVIRLLLGAMLAVVASGCGSVARQSVNQPPVVSDYKGWTISVVPAQQSELWRARVRVWPPEVRPEAHPGIELGFSGAATDRGAVVQAATTAARRYIDASVPTH